jgi:hypothetical protein
MSSTSKKKRYHSGLVSAPSEIPASSFGDSSIQLPSLPVLQRVDQKKGLQKASCQDRELEAKDQKNVPKTIELELKVRSNIRKKATCKKKLNSAETKESKSKSTLSLLESEIDNLRSQVSMLNEKIAHLDNDTSKSLTSLSLDPISFSQVAEPSDSFSKKSSSALPVYELHESKAGPPMESSGIFSSMLDLARFYWLSGDWSALSKIDITQIAHHPDRGKLALFASIGHNHSGNFAESKRLLRFSRQWGCSRDLIARLVMASAHRSVAFLMQLNGNDNKAQLHFNAAVSATGERALCFPEQRMADGNLSLNNSSYPLKTSRYKNLNNYKNQKIPRLIIAGGMVRSGSTALLNIAIDLLKSSGINPVKYFTSELKDINTFRDHILENKGVSFILKSHDMEGGLPELCREMRAKTLFSIRNIFEISASYIRMAQNPDSEFYQTREFSLDQLIGIIRYEIDFFDVACKLENIKLFNCKEISSNNLVSLVEKIDRFLEIGNTPSKIQDIAEKHCRKNNALFTSRISPNQFTSLKHDADTFFHKNHVLKNGTPVEDFLSEDWKVKIISRFSPRISIEGDLLI